jgi:hypothetical protein
LRKWEKVLEYWASCHPRTIIPSAIESIRGSGLGTLGALSRQISNHELRGFCRIHSIKLSARPKYLKLTMFQTVHHIRQEKKWQRRELILDFTDLRHMYYVYSKGSIFLATRYGEFLQGLGFNILFVEDYDGRSTKAE